MAVECDAWCDLSAFGGRSSPRRLPLRRSRSRIGGPYATPRRRSLELHPRPRWSSGRSVGQETRPVLRNVSSCRRPLRVPGGRRVRGSVVRRSWEHDVSEMRRSESRVCSLQRLTLRPFEVVRNVAVYRPSRGRRVQSAPDVLSSSLLKRSNRPPFLGGNPIHSGRITASTTWMTPLDASISVFTTLAPPTMTLGADLPSPFFTVIGAVIPAAVGAPLRVTTVSA